jgi:seryl-tRNA synthetase
MPIDINELRDYKGGDPAKYKLYMEQRFKDGTIVDQVVALDAEWRAQRQAVDALRKQANAYQTTVIAPKKKAKEDCVAELQHFKDLQGKIKEAEAVMPITEAKRDALLNRIGNLVDPEVPISKVEDADNLVIHLSPMPTSETETVAFLPQKVSLLKYTMPPSKPLTHDDLLWRIGGYEPVRGQVVAGHRGYFLTNAGVLLNQAIINYGLAFLSARDYQVIQPPYLMNKQVMAEIAQLEDFDEQLYKVSGKSVSATTTAEEAAASEKYLIATSEQPLCAYHKNDWIDPKQLPLRYAGLSTCFRKEAGSAGRDIRGIFRVHQFDKLEQFCLTVDDFEVSSAEQKRMLQCAQDFYDSLGIAYRVVCLVSGELNDAAVKKYDLEGWFPGQNTYRELVSCSNCTDYQARGVGVRCGQKKTGPAAANARASYCHMLNATLCATGRGICAILETHQTEDGVIVPEVLRPYMAGKEFLPFVRGPPELSKGEKGQVAGASGGK